MRNIAASFLLIALLLSQQARGQDPPPDQRPKLEFFGHAHVRPKDENQSLAGQYWLADGTVVSDQTRLAPLRRMSGWPMNPEEASRHLFLFISHGMPGAALGQLELLGADGHALDKDVKSVVPNAVRFGDETVPGWSQFMVFVPEGLKLPDAGKVRVRYAAGPWQRCASTSGSSTEFGKSLATGVTLLTAGQTAENRAFISVHIRADQQSEYEFDVKGEDAQGNQVDPSGQRFGFPEGFTALFDARLSSLDAIYLRRRPKSVVTFDQVSFRPRRRKN